MKHPRPRKLISTARVFPLIGLLALLIPIGPASQAQAPDPEMRTLAPEIVTDMKLKEQIEGIVINRVVTKQDGQPLKITGFTTDQRRPNSGRKNPSVLEFSVDDSSPQNVVITVTISKSALAGNPNDEIQTDYMSIGFQRGTGSCWQECWKEGGQRVCERVCY